MIIVVVTIVATRSHSSVATYTKFVLWNLFLWLPEKIFAEHIQYWKYLQQPSKSNWLEVPLSALLSS